MKFLYNKFLYFPFLNALVLLYDYFSDLGVAIIILTILIRIVLFPIFHKSVKNQTILQKIQPKIKEINRKHKDNKEEQVKELLNLYKEHRVNPLTGFLLLFIQLPILIALFQVFYFGLNGDLSQNLYYFVGNPPNIDFSFLNLINLKESSIFIVVLAALIQYIQGYLGLPKKSAGNSPADKISRQMVFIAPLLTFVILFKMPSAIGLYWITTSFFSIFQQLIINNSIKKKYE